MRKLEEWKEWKKGKDGRKSQARSILPSRFTFHVSRFTFCLFACLFGFTLHSAPIAAGFSTSGRGILYTIESIDALTDAVMRQPDGSYQITSSLTIANHIRPDILQLSPGVTLRFAKGSALQVDGTLIALGTKDSPITFTSIGEEWGGIVFSQSAPLTPSPSRSEAGWGEGQSLPRSIGGVRGEASVIENARIENAHIGISCQNASPRIASVHISRCKTYAIAVASAKPIIQKNRFSTPRAAAAIYSQSASPEIIDNHFELTPSQTGIILIDSDAHVAKNQFLGGGSAISCRASSPKIENNVITGANIAISGLQSDFVITGNQITDSPTGIYVDRGQPTLRSNHIHKSSVAAISIWDSPQGTVSENIIAQSKIGLYSKGANLTIDQNQFQVTDYAIYIKAGAAQVYRNVLNNSTEAGIAFWAGAAGEVRDNDLRENRYGVYAQDSSPTIRQNRIAGGEYGIRIQSASPPIVGNQISGAAEGGIGCWDANPEIESNTITQSRYGIYCDSASPLIAQNMIIDSRDAGVAGWNGSRPNMRDNTISGGRYEVFRDDLPPEARKRENEKTREREGEGPAKPATGEQAKGRKGRMEEGKDETAAESKVAGRKGRMEEGKDGRETTKPEGQETTHQPSNLPLPQSSNLPPQSSDTGNGSSSLFNAAEQETLRRGQRANPPTEATRHTTYQLRQMPPGEGGNPVEEQDNNAKPSNPQSQLPDTGYHSTDDLPAPRLSQGVKGPSLNKEQSSRLMSLEEMLADDSIDINEKIAKQFEAGQLYFKGGKYQQALDAYNWILTQFAQQMKKRPSGDDGKNNRELANIHYHCALSYYELKNYASAVNAARMCLSFNPEPAVKLRAQYTLAMSAMQNHASQMAEQAFLELIGELENQPTGSAGASPSLLSSAYFQLGRLAAERRAYREAAEHYSNALVHGIGGEQRAETLSELGYCALQAGDREVAIGWYRKLIEDSAAHSGLLVPAFLALGDVHREAGEWKQAEPFYRSARQHAD
ncbi:right-handed parallel beta-helix repeat-containing protein, partial [Candidatus Poribacteria bacterium]|nr:right-handed parallel beta-helix repeat-containing protein [Candidatus Poribacteria bacterium]